MSSVTNSVRIHHTYIADGLAEDCEELIMRCMRVSKLSYEKFCSVWRQMDFACIFHNRSSGAEIAEFSEEALHIAKYFMVSNIEHFEKSVAGLFLIYAILNLQPFQKFAALRLVQDDVPAIEQLELVARKERRHDILYILGEVLIRGPCQFHVSPRERGLDFCIRKYYDGYTLDSIVGQRATGVLHKQNEELEIIRELKLIGKQYDDAKKVVSGSSKSERSFKYVVDDMADQFESSLKIIVPGIVTQNDETEKHTHPPAETPVPLPEHSDAVASIKAKAMKTAVNPIRHRVGVNDRNQPSAPEPSTSTATKPKSPMKSYKELLKTKKVPKETATSPIKSPSKPYHRSLKPILDDDFSDLDVPRKPRDKITTQPNNSTAEESSDEDEENTETEVKRSTRKRSSKIIRIRNNTEDSPEEPPTKKPQRILQKPSNNDNSQKDDNVIPTDLQITTPLVVSNNNNVEIEIIDEFIDNNLPKDSGPSTNSTRPNRKNYDKKYLKLTKIKSRIKKLGITEITDFDSDADESCS